MKKICTLILISLFLSTLPAVADSSALPVTGEVVSADLKQKNNMISGDAIALYTNNQEEEVSARVFLAVYDETGLCELVSRSLELYQDWAQPVCFYDLTVRVKGDATIKLMLWQEGAISPHTQILSVQKNIPEQQLPPQGTKYKGIVTEVSTNQATPKRHKLDVYDNTGGWQPEIFYDDGRLPVHTMLGREVYFYIRDVGNMEFITHMELTNEDKVISIAPENLVHRDDYEISFMQDDEPNMLNLSDNARFFYNYQRVYDADAWDGLTFDPALNGSGEILLIDSDKDDEIDYLVLTAVTDQSFVKYIDRDKGRMYDQHGYPIWFADFDSGLGFRSFYFADGSKASYADIEEGCVLSMFESEDYESAVIYISNEYIEGTIEDITNRDSKNYVVIDGEEYMLSAFANTSMPIGATGKFHLGMDGQIVYADVPQPDPYAYLCAAYIDIGLGGSTVQILALKRNGEKEILDLASVVTFYSNTGSTESVPSTAENGSRFNYLYEIQDGQIQYTPRMFAYDLNQDGYVNRIYMLESDFSTESSRFSASDMSVGKCKLTEDTSVMIIPEDVNDLDGYCTAAVDEVFRDGYYYALDVYDMDPLGVPGIVALRGCTEQFTATDHCMIIDRVAAAGDILTLIGRQNGEYITQMTSENGYNIIDLYGEPYTAELAKRDVVVYSMDETGITEIRVIMPIDEFVERVDAEISPLLNESFGTNTVYFGIVSSKLTYTMLPGSLKVLDISTYPIESGSYDEMPIFIRGKTRIYGINTLSASLQVSDLDFSEITTDTRQGKQGSWVLAYQDDLIGIRDVVVYSAINQ